MELGMPSPKLQQLSNEIESNQTDHFGKFQLYLALLNSATNKGNETRDLGHYLPKPITVANLFFSKTCKLEIGPVSTNFLLSSTLYPNRFKPKLRNNDDNKKVLVLLELLGLWLRQSNIADLMFIIDQMLVHLKAMNESNNPNQAMINAMHFNRGEVIEFMEKISRMNHLVLATTDKTFNLLFCTLPIMIGLIAAIYGTFFDRSSISSLLSICCGVGGALMSLKIISDLHNKMDRAPQLYTQFKAELTRSETNPAFKDIKRIFENTLLTAMEQFATSDRDITVINDFRTTLANKF